VKPITRPIALVLGSLLVLAGLAPLAEAATPARAASPAGTLVYIKQHNVWASRVNGTGAYQVTRDGTAASPYRHPSMSDRGLIAVEHRRTIEVLRTNGALVARHDPPLFAKSDCIVVTAPGPPQHPKISPDGTKVAFDRFRTIRCIDRYRVESLTGIVSTTTGRFANDPVLGFQPSWATNSRVLVNHYVKYVDLGGGPNPTLWFQFDDLMNPADWGGYGIEITEPTLSRDGSRVAFVHGARDTVFVIPTQGDPRTGAPSKPLPGTGCYFTSDYTRTDPDASLIDSISLTADGSLLILRDGPDIVAVNVRIDDCTSSTAGVVVANAKDPFWSAADYTATKPVALANTAAPKISGTAKVGKKLTAKRGSWTGSPTSYSYQWYRGSKKIAKATTSSYRLKSADRGKKIRVKITAKRAGSVSHSAYSKYTGRVTR